MADDDLGEGSAGRVMPVGVHGRLEGEDTVDHGPQSVRLDEGVHRGELGAASDGDGPDGGTGGEQGTGVEGHGGFADETDARDRARQGNGADRLVEQSRDVDDAVGAPPVSVRTSAAQSGVAE